MTAMQAKSVERDRSSPYEGELRGILASVQKGLDTPGNNSNPDLVRAYAELLKSLNDPLKASSKTLVSFKLKLSEIAILGIWGLGSLFLLVLAGLASLGPSNSVQLVLYWSSVLAILLGAKGAASIKG